MEEISNILPAYMLENGTPSAQDGVTGEDERLHRLYGCELIAQAGAALKVSQVIIITGQNILNRFFYRKSLKRFDAFSIAMGSFLLASKVEEGFKTLREVLFAFHYVYGKRKGLMLKPMELGGQQYTLWKNELLMVERYILKELGFSLYNIMDHPHKYILYFIKVLNGSELLASTAWNYLNDSMRLDLSLRFEAQTIACAAIHLAARKLRIALPENLDGSSWWDVFGATTVDMLQCGDEIVTVYDMKKVGWLEPLAPVEYLSPEICAQFDQVYSSEPGPGVIGTEAAAVQQDEQQTGVQSLTRSVTQVPFASAGDGTPKAGQTGGSGSSTPMASRAVKEGEEDGGGEVRKLERKWFSMAGDIDQMDTAPTNTINDNGPTVQGDQSGRRSRGRSRSASRAAAAVAESARRSNDRGASRASRRDRSPDRSDRSDRRRDSRDRGRSHSTDRYERRDAYRGGDSRRRERSRSRSGERRGRDGDRDRDRDHVRDRDRREARTDKGEGTQGRRDRNSRERSRGGDRRGSTSREGSRDRYRRRY